jgi:hypothetical protein
MPDEPGLKWADQSREWQVLKNGWPVLDVDTGLYCAVCLSLSSTMLLIGWHECMQMLKVGPC